MYMQASILDLRYKMRDVLAGLDRGETIVVTHQGKRRAKLVPIRESKTLSVKEHPYFGSRSDTENSASVAEYMKQLRKSRHAI